MGPLGPWAPVRRTVCTPVVPPLAASSVAECRERKRDRTPSASPAFRQAGKLSGKSNFQVRQKILTMALLAIVCRLVACFPTAALILIKKYIWVRICIAKRDLRLGMPPDP